MVETHYLWGEYILRISRKIYKHSMVFCGANTRKHSYALTRLPPIEGKGFCPMQPDKGAYFSLDPPFLHRQETALTRAK